VLARRGISPGVMREREWRRLFIADATPDAAADREETENHGQPGRRRAGLDVGAIGGGPAAAAQSRLR